MAGEGAGARLAGVDCVAFISPEKEVLIPVEKIAARHLDAVAPDRGPSCPRTRDFAVKNRFPRGCRLIGVRACPLAKFGESLGGREI